MRLEISSPIMSLASTFSDRSTGKFKILNLIHNRTETYNRVDKINMNNPKIVSPEKTGKNHF